MGTFDSIASSSEAIRIEGEQITIRFDRTGPTTGRVSWNIPPPAGGCTSETQAYCGILVTIDTIPASVSTAPVNGTTYTADPTADPDLFAGDNIGTSFVIGAFYEGVQKGTGEAFTTYFDVSGLTETTPYFVSGYAVSCTAMYHTQGVFAYSQPLGNDGTPDTSGHQCININGGVELSQGTGLTLGKDYSFSFIIDGVSYSIVVNGDDAQTYKQLIDTVNGEIGKLTTAPQGPLPPNAGAYWYNSDTGQLFQWDGSQNVETPVLNEPTDPTALAVGDYWYNTTTSVLSRWDGSMWVPIPASSVIEYSKDPTDIGDLTSEDFWLQLGSPSRGFGWCGNVWCERTLITQEDNPVCGITPTCGTYWYNPDDMALRQWNDRSNVWQERNAIYWNVDPSGIGSPSLMDGSYWFDETSEQLFQWGTAVPDMWTNRGLGYQDIILDGSTAPYALNDIALLEGTYTDDVTINGNTTTITLTICNAIDGTFGEVFKEITHQLQTDPLASGTISFRADGMGLRLLSDSTGAPVIGGGGDLFSSITDWASNGPSITGVIVTVGDEPELLVIVAGQYWVDTTNEKVFLRDAGNTTWNRVCTIFFPIDPTNRESCDLWWNSDTDVLSTWDAVGSMWIPVVSFIQDTIDPAGTQPLQVGDLWYQSSSNTLYEWDGSQWVSVNFVIFPVDPTSPTLGDIWKNGDLWYEWDGSMWVQFDPVNSPTDPSQSTIPTGTFWYDTMNIGLFVWNGMNWVPMMYSNVSLEPKIGDLWFDSSEGVLKVWNGVGWVPSLPIATLFQSIGDSDCKSSAPCASGDCTETEDADCALCLRSNTTGSSSTVVIDETSTMVTSLTGFSGLCFSICGIDGLEGIPSYAQQGVGTDGSSDERRQMTDTVRRLLGWPTIEVELDKEQMNLAVTIALEELRRRSSSGTRRGFMKLHIRPGVQRYQLSNDGQCGAGYEKPDGTFTGYNSIVQVMGVYRVTSAFLSSANGGGVFGQVVLQHLYNMGTFDLLSYYLVSQYIEQLEHLFASRLTFSWNETDRILWLQQSFSNYETTLMDVAVERTEQDLFTDRFTSRWIEKYATAQAKLMLSQIRGKFSTLPGAGGGVTLNAADLQNQAQDEMEELISQIDNYQVNNVEEFGMNCEFIIG